jgi:hypothetical protein
VLTNREVEVSRGYSGTLTCGTKLDVEKGVEHITADLDAHAADRMVIQAAMTIKALVAALEAVDQPLFGDRTAGSDQGMASVRRLAPVELNTRP